MGKVRCINCMKMIDGETAFCPHCGYGQKEEQSPFGMKPGTILRGRYLIGRMLGQGGFGITYVGYDLTLDIRVAVKEYFPSGSVTRNSTVSNQVQWNTAQMSGEQWRAGCEGFLTEARRMAKTDSLPGIVRVRDTFPENQTAYIVMDYIEGETLKQRLVETGPMEAGECLRLLRPLMESLETMHGKGLIHRDISPDNIMVRPEGSACLLDFGAAKDISFQQTAASRQVAKKGFSPPEQYREKGSIGPWTDVYALCATIYYCITGKLVPDAMERLYEDTMDLGALLSGTHDAAVADALRDGLKLRPEERIRTVGELLKRLEGTETAGDRKEPEAVGTGWKVDPCENLWKDRASQENQEALLYRGGSTVQPEDVEKKPESSEKTQGSAVKEQIAQDTGTGRRKKRISKKTAVVAAVVAVVFLLFGHGGKDTMREVVVPSQTEDELSIDANQQQGGEPETPSQTEKELPVDTGKPQDGEAADGAGDTEMVSTDEESEVTERSNILMKDDSCEYSKDDEEYHGTVLGSEISRDRIRAVQFVDTLDGMTDSAWDVSAGTDGTVMAWTKPDPSDGQMLNLVIGAEGKIRAEDCLGLFKGYSNVEQIDFNGCFDTSHVTSMEDMFCGCKNLTQLDVDGFDTSHVTSMGAMFLGCKNLTQLDVSGFDTSHVTDIWSMFYDCGNLMQLDVSGFDTSRVTNMYGMFNGCASLTQLDVSGFDTSQVMSMGGMFGRCRNLTQLDVRSFDTSQVWNMDWMFQGCESLTQLDVSGFDTSQVTEMSFMFFGCSSLTQLDVSGFDTGKVTDMEAMLDGCGVTAEEAGLKTN